MRSLLLFVKPKKGNTKRKKPFPNNVPYSMNTYEHESYTKKKLSNFVLKSPELPQLFLIIFVAKNFL